MAAKNFPSSAPFRLLVRNMVCARCLRAVEDLLRAQGLPFEKVTLGEVWLGSKPDAAQRQRLSEGLQELGFALLETRVQQLVGRIRQAVIDYVALGADAGRMKLSAHIRQHIPNDYSYLSDLFSSVEGRSIEQFFLQQRIEKVKELLVYDQQSLTQIAYETGFSSVHHLSAQFRKLTGMTPSHFRRLASHDRRSLDEA